MLYIMCTYEIQGNFVVNKLCNVAGIHKSIKRTINLLKKKILLKVTNFNYSRKENKQHQ